MPSMLDHRLRASTPPTLTEAWAAVLDNPKLCQRVARDEGNGTDDDLQEARLAAAQAFVRWDLVRSKDILGLTRWAFRQARLDLERPVRIPRGTEDAFRQWGREIAGLRVRGLPVPALPPPELPLPRDAVALATLRHRIGVECAHDPQQRADAETGHGLWIEALQTTEPVESEALLDRALNRAWVRLDADDRALLQDRFEHDQTLDELAASRGISRERARQRLNAALRHLRAWMEPRLSVLLGASRSSSASRR